LENSQQRLSPLQNGKTFILNLPGNQAWQAVMGLSAGPGIIAAALRNMIEIRSKNAIIEMPFLGGHAAPILQIKMAPFQRDHLTDVPFNPTFPDAA